MRKQCGRLLNVLALMPLRLSLPLCGAVCAICLLLPAFLSSHGRIVSAAAEAGQIIALILSFLILAPALAEAWLGCRRKEPGAAARPIELNGEAELPGLAQQNGSDRTLRGSDNGSGLFRCPQCGAQVDLKDARQGNHAGLRYWVCCRYPGCNGILAYCLQEPEAPDSDQEQPEQAEKPYAWLRDECRVKS